MTLPGHDMIMAAHGFARSWPDSSDQLAAHGGRSAWSIIVRLLVFALTALAFAQPALAREHYHHRYSTHGVHSHHQLVRAQARHAWRSATWRHHGQWARGDVVEPRASARHGELDAMIARHALTNGLPEALVHRVVIRESRYNAHVVGAGGAMGLMQIKLGTAREMGYTGTAAGLLDPETNLTYAVRYLAGAYRVAAGNADRAVANYARGYRDTVREGAAPARAVASAETSGWSNSYASAAPAERVAWVRSHGRRQLMRAH
jgi:soluble lytic murein transglycosylase-like protein